MKKKNKYVESLVLIAFDEHCNVSFIGKESRYLELCKELSDFNKNREIKHNFLKNCELIYFDKEWYESSLDKIIYNILKNRYNKIEPWAKVYAEVFRKSKIKDYL